MFHNEPKPISYLNTPNFFFFAVHPTIKINIQDSEAAAAGKIEQRRENYPPITYA